MVNSGNPVRVESCRRFPYRIEACTNRSWNWSLPAVASVTITSLPAETCSYRCPVRRSSTDSAALLVFSATSRVALVIPSHAARFAGAATLTWPAFSNEKSSTHAVTGPKPIKRG